MNEVEKSSHDSLELVKELEKKQEEHQRLESLFFDSQKEVGMYKQKLENLQSQLTVSEQLYLEERARCESQEISLVALKSRLQYYAENHLGNSFGLSHECHLIPNRQLSEVERFWEIAPLTIEQEDETSEMASVTEKYSDCEGSTSTIVRYSRESVSNDGDDHFSTDEVAASKAIKRCRSSDDNPNSGTVGMLSKVNNPLNSIN